MQLIIYIVFIHTAISRTAAVQESLYSGNVVTVDSATRNPLIVSTVYSAPFMMPDRGHFQGFIPDLLSEIKSITGLDFKIQLAKDGRYGDMTRQSNNVIRWNGTMGDVISGTADVAAADLTVTSTRERFVDFSVPFTTTRLKVLLRKRKNERSPEIPKTLAELMAQNYKLLVIYGGSTQSFLRTSHDPFYRRVWSTMTSDNYVKSLMDGVRRTRTEGKTAFITEGTTIDMLTSQVYYCGGLTTLGEEYGPVKLFALAVREGDALRETLSRAVLQIEERGLLDTLRKKWWYSPCG